MSNIKVFNYGSEEFKRLELACNLLNEFDKEAKYRVGVTWFDFGQDWKWTTIIVEYDSKWSNGYQIDPKNHEDILNAREMKDLVEVCELLISQRKKLSSK